MAIDVTSYILSKGFTSDTADSLGAVKGAPCTIKSTTETDEGTVITFEWIGTSGTSQTSSIIVKNGKSIINASIDNSNNLFFTLSDNSIISAGSIFTLKGDAGYSPTIKENPDNDSNTYKLDITNKDGTFTTPNLKGKDGDFSNSNLDNIEIIQGKI